MEGGNAELSGVKSFGDVLLCFFFRLDFYFNFSNQGLSPFKFTFPLSSLYNCIPQKKLYASWIYSFIFKWYAFIVPQNHKLEESINFRKFMIRPRQADSKKEEFS